MSATKGILQRNILLYLMHCRVCLLASSTLQSLKTSVGQKKPLKISQIKTLLTLVFFFFQKQTFQKVKGAALHLGKLIFKNMSRPKITNRPNVTTSLPYHYFLCHFYQYFHPFLCWQGRGSLQVFVRMY